MATIDAIPFVSALVVQGGGMIARRFADLDIDRMPELPDSATTETDAYAKPELKRRQARDADAIQVVGTSIATAPSVFFIVRDNFPDRDDILTIVILILAAVPLLLSTVIALTPVHVWDRLSRVCGWSPVTWAVFTICTIGLIWSFVC